MKSKKDTKKIQVKQKKKTRKNQPNKRKTKKECCKIGSGRTYRKRRRNQKTCAICLEKIRYADLIYTECKHPFHIECLEEWCATNHSKRTVPCPYCRHPINGTCSEIYQVNYETQFEVQGEPIPPMVHIPRWYIGDTFAQIQTPEDNPPYPPYTPEDSPPMTISSSIEYIPHSPTESPPSSRANSISTISDPRDLYVSPPDESTMDVVEIIEPLQPNISDSLSPIHPINSLSPESRINRDAYDDTLNRLHNRLRQ